MGIPLLIFLTVANVSISGRISVPENLRVTKPIQVVLLTAPYTEVYSTELQKRIDSYWEDYRTAFIQDKDAFVLFRERAKRQALESALTRMREDDTLKAGSRIVNTTNNSF